MRREAEAHQAEDQRKKALAEERNRAESLIYTAERTLKDAGDKISPEDKRSIEDAITALRGVMQGEDKEEITRKANELSNKLSEVGAKLYEQNTNPENPADKEPPKDNQK
jgi:molecular chaperone DnaK